ncbi:protein-glutamine gamma-glutamyltransferase [Paenibacillus abyssi]|uniref:Protein-glutamine gamma-glutamyltransferase n=1 Tax=Paenibacillus abyssi TaxID=1340531 RepID=A0A917LFW3_9BACL|nr:protein-glutamine gamma-glutamyltransferase [Paenibacillus abyssi]GGG19440.1 protein-glutamine gamma-glutamyltransferase [Paenibacillus abyssi]
MILIAGEERTVDVSSWPQLAKDIYEQKRTSPRTYNYNSIYHLQFEMTLRIKIVEAADALDQSGVSFATFEKSKCNDQYWKLTDEGGFQLKMAVTPAEGIRDIFRNGRQYSFECATAIVIVLYKAVLDVIQDHEFNRLFANLLLYDWHYDSDLRLIQEQGSQYSYPGDILYFKNPDVAPETPQWQGENAVKLDDDLYYGHGIGILPAQGIINRLNQLRRPGSVTSAYMTEQVVFPDFLYLSQFAPGADRLHNIALFHFTTGIPSIRVLIGSQRWHA